MTWNQSERLHADLSICFHLRAENVVTVGCGVAPELPCYQADVEAWFRLDWTLNLQPDDVLTVVGATESTGNLNLVTPRPTNAVYYDRGREVQPGKAAEVYVTNPTNTPGMYEIEFLLEDNSGNKIPYAVRVRME